MIKDKISLLLMWLSNTWYKLVKRLLTGLVLMIISIMLLLLIIPEIVLGDKVMHWLDRVNKFINPKENE